MKVILIDPSNKTVTEVEMGLGLQPMYDLIGNECNMIESPSVDFPNGDVIYCDEEGLFHENIGGIINDKWSYPIVGRIIVCSCDEEGENGNVSSTVDEIKSHIKFINSDTFALVDWFEQFN